MNNYVKINDKFEEVNMPVKPTDTKKDEPTKDNVNVTENKIDYVESKDSKNVVDTPDSQTLKPEAEPVSWSKPPRLKVAKHDKQPLDTDVNVEKDNTSNKSPKKQN